MTNPNPDPNTRLSDVFEMLVARLDTIETKLDLLKTHARQADADRPLGQVFSGLALTGQRVNLQVFDAFDSDGVFTKQLHHCHYQHEHLLLQCGGVFPIDKVNEDMKYFPKAEIKQPGFSFGDYCSLTPLCSVGEAISVAKQWAIKKGVTFTNLKIYSIPEWLQPLTQAVIDGDEATYTVLWNAFDKTRQLSLLENFNAYSDIFYYVFHESTEEEEENELSE